MVVLCRAARDRGKFMGVETVPPIAVAIVEDDTRLREGLAMLIAGTPGYRLTGTFPSVEEALAAIATAAPDVLLLDIHLPGMLGSEGVRHLRARSPRTQVLMLTVFEEGERVFESICNGACGYLLKKTQPARLLEAIREAHEGGSPMSPEIARKVVSLFQKTNPPADPETRLTPHEIRLLKLLAEGHSYQSAGQVLGSTINTVRNYIRSIYEKLQVHSKSEAVTKALRAGWIA
jgi:DNA-binding NarL/FixJ family response regulator